VCLFVFTGKHHKILLSTFVIKICSLFSQALLLTVVLMIVFLNFKLTMYVYSNTVVTIVVITIMVITNSRL
jgi:hypothetical protein